ncbi:unnamed protein product, partial [Mesorhabditis belari]|uniref:Uncharacterized protein n=1 Tax=Mesorhabditis belari TaxID=2138241 RepID=A0AAF3J493_9BILA
MKPRRPVFGSVGERKLKELKDPNGKKATAKAFLSDLASHKDHQLFRLISGAEGNQLPGRNALDDNFVDVPIQPNFVQRKIAPQTCAINKQEKLRLLKHDIVQILHKEVEDELKEETEDFAKELREMEWREVAFSSTPNSFHAFSLPQTSTLDVSDKSNSSNLRACLIGATGVCRIINYKSSSTKVFWLRAVIKTINLVEIMKIQIDATKFFEVSDAKLYRDGDETLLCASWVQQDVNCSVLEQFVTLFRVIDEGIVFVEKFSLDKPWASTMIINDHVNHSLLVLFPLRAEPIFFKVSSEKLDHFDASSDPNFVSLASNVNKDLILRSSRHIDRDFVWNAVGSDAGILTISLHNSSTKTLIGSRSFKFSGIISIVEFLGASRDEKLSSKYSEVLLLVSSSVGPTMIWQCCVSETGELSIGKDGCELHESTGKDVITSALVVKNWIFVGTYAGIFLVYQRPKLFDLLPEVLDTAYSVDISSPIISLCALSDEGHMDGVLTTEGRDRSRTMIGAKAD